LNFGFLIFPDTEELDLVGPWEIINVWREFEGGPENCFIVGEQRGEFRCAKGLRISADYSYADCPPLDYLLIPGGKGRRQQVDNPETIKFVREQAARCKHVLSVCTGAFILKAAGLLERATTHWGSLDELRAFDDLTVTEDRYVRHGNIWTAAGVSAGIDMALRLVATEAGEDTAGRVQLYAEYFPEKRIYGEVHRDPRAPQYARSSS
jgi:transcriptional regulator GlxA family with amidase domain